MTSGGPSGQLGEVDGLGGHRIDRCMFCHWDELVVLGLRSSDDESYSNEIVCCAHCGREYERTVTGEYVR